MKKLYFIFVSVACAFTSCAKQRHDTGNRFVSIDVSASYDSKTQTIGSKLECNGKNESIRGWVCDAGLAKSVSDVTPEYLSQPTTQMITCIPNQTATTILLSHAPCPSAETYIYIECRDAYSPEIKLKISKLCV